MNALPLVSIIIPTYNRAHIIGETLDSIIAQTYTNWECIVVDDGSTDDTDEVLKKYIQKDGRFRYLKRPENRKRGGNAARNYGFENSIGDYIQWFDSDDYMMVDKLESQINDLIQSSYKISICSGVRYYPSTKIEKKLRIDYKNDIFCQVASNSSEIMTPSLLINREEYIKTGVKFHEEMTRGQETYFLIELISNVDSNLIVQSDKRLFKYVIHDDSISKSDDKYNPSHVMSKAIAFSRIWYLNKNYNCQSVSNKMYKKCVRLLFSSLRNNEYKISKYILKKMKINLKPQNRILYYRIFLYYTIFRIFKKPQYYFMNDLLNRKFNS